MKRLKRAYKKNIKQRGSFKHKALTAGAAAAITFGAGAGIHKVFAMTEPLPYEHKNAVSGDSDADLLSDSEEFAIGYHPFKADQNKNGISDGVELAQRVATVIDGLPTYNPNSLPTEPNEIYRIALLQKGLETCDICGEYLNMGGYEIVNPRTGTTFPDPNDPLDDQFLPVLAIHYMSHGSFDCLGAVHKGRTDIARLLNVLELQFPYDSNDHQLALDKTDTDNDLLADGEELSAGFNPKNPDQNVNLIPDGIEFAQQCAAVIESLPEVDANEPDATNHIYKESHMLRGLEFCDTCGESVNMGYWTVTNAGLGLSVEVPEIVLHYMQHGSFSYSGDVHGKGRIDAALLKKILEMPRRCGDLGTIYLPTDVNQDCEADNFDLYEYIEMWLEESNYNSE
ncbi:MAG: hypothetical protein JW787_16760 [Sedimentisphaerales bacterium]|nr:hypothetical protein [Sedimentisphaerales bacterium]